MPLMMLIVTVNFTDQNFLKTPENSLHKFNSSITKHMNAKSWSSGAMHIRN